MSSPNPSIQSENSSKKIEEARVSSKQEQSALNDEGIKCSLTVAKTEQPAQPPVTNGALPESEVKVVGNGIESTSNGADEKSTNDGPHREVPALLPLGSINTSPVTPQGGTTSSSPNPPGRQPVPQLLPMNAATSPVVATKSAPPPPINAAGKTRGRTSATTSSSPAKEKPATSPTKEQQSSGLALRNKKEPEDQEPTQEKESKKRKPVSKKRHSVASSDSMEKGDVDSGGDGDASRKSKRARTQTQPFQSSDLDVSSYIRVIKAAQPSAAAQQAKVNEEKLVVFFKGEFLAVRNAEGGFYICQAIQNIYRGSHKIRIRWLSQASKEDAKTKKKTKAVVEPEPVKDETGFDIYIPDFYDNTDFECILTNLELEKFGRDRYGLPLDERQRTENILRRAIEVEEGKVDKLELTEEHPDGLDVSLFHDESQLKRKRRSDGKEDDSSSESDSDSKEEVATTSGSSGKSSRSTEPEPRTSTSGVASTSSGRGTKRTRAAAIAADRKKLQQMRYQKDDSDDSSDDDDDDEDDDDDDDESSSESETEKRGRGRSSPRRSRQAPLSKARSSTNARSARGKKLVTPPTKKGPIPIIRKQPAKPPAKPSPSVSASRRKATRVSEKPSSPEEKIVTVDVEMAGNESPADGEPKDEPKTEIKPDAVMAEEKESKESTTPKKEEAPKPKESTVEEKDPLAVEPEPKDNDTKTTTDTKSKDEDKEAKSQASTKNDAEKEPEKEKSEKEVKDAKTESKTPEAKE